MILFKHSKDLQSYLNYLANTKKTTGFVPTMGALHKGHLSLIAQSRKHADISICSIFVNPVQFNNKEDFKKYPSTIENDILLLEGAGCDIAFIPSEDEIYPGGNYNLKHYELGDLENILEGEFRPGHFQGVCLVMEKLLDIINPSVLLLGQKDYQQCLVIKRLIGLLNKPIEVVICPILREVSGLAMSSRNQRLNEQEKKLASELYKTLVQIKENINANNFLHLKKNELTRLENLGFKVDYLELTKSNDLEIVEHCTNNENYFVLIAAFINTVRLIDNLEVTCQY
jgi:pantoate--beta-alanine ligase